MTSETYCFFRGRVAEHAILQSLGVGPGDEVAIQAFTCVALPAPILVLGAKPIYIDIDERTYNLDPEHLRASITNQTKAVIVQHTFGIPAAMDAILDISRRRGLAVIEDCCHTLASEYDGQVVGSFGIASFTSHRWGKPIVLGAGATATVRTDEICARFRDVCASSKPTSARKTMQVLIELFAYDNLLRPSMFWVIRDVFRMLSHSGMVMPTFGENELQGLMVDSGRRIPQVHRRKLARALSKLSENTAFRRSIADQYDKVLRDLGAQTFDVDKRFNPVFLRYPLLVENKPAVLERARKRRIELGDWFMSAVHPLTSREDLRRIGYELGSCPAAEAVSRAVITLPIYEKITPRYVEKTIRFLHELAAERLLTAPSFMQMRYA